MFFVISAGHACSLDPSTAHFAPFSILGSPPATIEVGKDWSYNISCPNGWVFDYTNSQRAETQTVECPAYVQGETRTLHYMNSNESVCLREYLV